MTKKILLFLILICSTSLGITAERYTGVRTNLDNTWNILQPYTTAAFTVYATSDVANVVTCIFTINNSSITTELRTKLAGGATTYHYYNLLLSTSDSMQDIVDRIDEKPNFVCTLAQGCYENLLATGTANARDDEEGKTEGLQFNLNGDKTVSFSTGTANAITIYLNATRYLSHRKTAEAGKTFIVGKLSSNLLWSGTARIDGSVYEGNVSTNCTTILDVPLPGTSSNAYYEINYPMPFPLMSATGSGKAQKYEVLCSTYITGGYIGIIGETR